jgi:alpha-amylase
MSTKYWSDGDVHAYFSHYESPYDAYINYMNVLNNFKISFLVSKLNAFDYIDSEQLVSPAH